jgi:lysozyme family protein
VKQNFDKFIALVWPADGDFDSPKTGYNITPGDPGGGTKGGVIENTWSQYEAQGLVTGQLKDATDAQLLTVLRAEAWGYVGDVLPSGLDILIANGRMMTGAYQTLVEECLGQTGADVDGCIGPHALALLAVADARTLILALHGNHYRYLSSLVTWAGFKNGWIRRLEAAKAAALAAL